MPMLSHGQSPGPESLIHIGPIVIIVGLSSLPPRTNLASYPGADPEAAIPKPSAHANERALTRGSGARKECLKEVR